jgi:predicted regulator of Ras-like GTPase activity (Roadblock/LC7/MglB family)
MNDFDFDLDRFANAMDMKGFDVVLLIDADGTVIAENSVTEFDCESLAEHCSSILHLSKSLSDHLEFGAPASTTFEFQDRTLLIRHVDLFALCGVLGQDTTITDARDAMSKAMKSLL